MNISEMEAVLLHSSSADQSIAPYKHIRNPRNLRPLISRPFESFAPSNFRGGILHAPPPSLSSYPPPVSFLNPPQQNPPLLPLPIPKPNNNSLSRGLSCPPINRKINSRTRDQSRTPKKSKPTVSPKKRDLKSTTKTASSESAIIASTKPLGPDPKDLPKDVSRVLSSSAVGNYNDLEEVSSSAVFTLSPPPSSLPLPTFSLRPKLSCNAVAAGIDAGATDNLQRLLRLR